MRFLTHLLLAVSLLSSAQAVPVIANSPSSVILSFGPTPSTWTETFGQQFLVSGPEVDLTSFSLFTSSVSAPITYRAYVQEWDTLNNTVTGPILFESSVTNLLVGANLVNTGSLTLTTGRHYLAYFTTLTADNSGTGQAPLLTGGPDPNLVMLRFNNSNTFSNGPTPPPGPVVPPLWNDGLSFFPNLLFNATFAAVGAPELNGAAALTPLMAMAVLLCLGSGRRRTPAE